MKLGGACLSVALRGELVAGAQVLDVVAPVGNLLQQLVDPLYLLQSHSRGLQTVHRPVKPHSCCDRHDRRPSQTCSARQSARSLRVASCHMHSIHGPGLRNRCQLCEDLLHSLCPYFIIYFPIRRSGALQQTSYGSPPACPVLGFCLPCV